MKKYGTKKEKYEKNRKQNKKITKKIRNKHENHVFSVAVRTFGGKFPGNFWENSRKLSGNSQKFQENS